jgi:hypothetical protein
LSGSIALKVAKKQGMNLASTTVSGSTNSGKTNGPQTTINNSNAKYQGMKTAGAIISTIGTRDLSANSDKATVPNPPPISNSLLK